MRLKGEAVRALTFDVFGTVVDWRGSVIREGERLGTEHGLTVDWAAFADRWRAGYKPAMDRVRRGDLPWANLDRLHRIILDQLLAAFDVRDLDEATVANFNRVWHRLQPWPDAISGLTRLRGRYMLATLSNGNMALLAAMAKHAGLPWDMILSAELARHYKPDPETYLLAVELLDCHPSAVMMVAAHPDDLRAARALGLRTAFVARPDEHGLPRRQVVYEAAEFDIVAGDFNDLSEQMGC